MTNPTQQLPVSDKATTFEEALTLWKGMAAKASAILEAQEEDASDMDIDEPEQPSSAPLTSTRIFTLRDLNRITYRIEARAQAFLESSSLILLEESAEDLVEFQGDGEEDDEEDEGEIDDPTADLTLTPEQKRVVEQRFNAEGISWLQQRYQPLQNSAKDQARAVVPYIVDILSSYPAFEKDSERTLQMVQGGVFPRGFLVGNHLERLCAIAFTANPTLGRVFEEAASAAGPRKYITSQQLRTCLRSVQSSDNSNNRPAPGIYAFALDDVDSTRPFYIGRSVNVPRRLREHGSPSCPGVNRYVRAAKALGAPFKQGWLVDLRNFEDPADAMSKDPTSSVPASCVVALETILIACHGSTRGESPSQHNIVDAMSGYLPFVPLGPEAVADIWSMFKQLVPDPSDISRDLLPQVHPFSKWKDILAPIAVKYETNEQYIWRLLFMTMSARALVCGERWCQDALVIRRLRLQDGDFMAQIANCAFERRPILLAPYPSVKEFRIREELLANGGDITDESTRYPFSSRPNNQVLGPLDWLILAPDREFPLDENRALVEQSYRDAYSKIGIYN
jgi:hypothetical protein